MAKKNSGEITYLLTIEINNNNGAGVRICPFKFFYLKE